MPIYVLIMFELIRNQSIIIIIIIHLLYWLSTSFYRKFLFLDLDVHVIMFVTPKVKSS